ncbi:MAG: dihydroorotase [Odoribacteraceae bacterium]|jgi:dihydroorotase|nr:dihydroorotase [Odoribacteraceae bacterium]
MKTLVRGGEIVNEGRVFRGDLLLDGECIAAVAEGGVAAVPPGADVIDAEGMLVLPGAIDDQVHFREPGLTWKEDIAAGSRAAAAGGVTSFMDMPNVVPPTTTLARLEEKREIARRASLVNYAFYLGASAGNLEEIRRVDPRVTCGVKVFMGSSTGDLLLDDASALDRVFEIAPVLVATHCEDNAIIRENLARFEAIHGEDIPPSCHPLVRSRACCLASSSLAVRVARAHPGSRLHILHLSTREELELLDGGARDTRQVTGEACIHHLWFNDSAYLRHGNRVKWNPAIKEEDDRRALLEAVNDGRIDVVATDHAPHLPAEKEGTYTRAASGGPMIQHSLVAMLQLAERGETTIATVVERMCHAPADVFRVEARGYLREGYRADIVLVRRDAWRVTPGNLLYKCGWSPLEGVEFTHRVAATIVNGQVVYRDGRFTGARPAQPLLFRGGRS